MRPELKDGKTEWFMITYPELRESIMMIKRAMIALFDDTGLDEYSKATLPKWASLSSSKLLFATLRTKLKYTLWTQANSWRRVECLVSRIYASYGKQKMIIINILKF